MRHQKQRGKLSRDSAHRKALMNNLGPGKYEVRAGDLRGFVDVVAGKTAELNLGPKK